MAEDFYKTLGIARGATPEQIQKAYRELARKYHPDRNPDDKQAKAKFQEVQKAFEVLNDPKKREMYDRYGAAFEQAGATGAGPGQGGWSYAPGGGFPDIDLDVSQLFGERFGQEGGGGFSDIFSQFRRAQTGTAGAGKRKGGARGEDLTHEIAIPFKTAVLGGTTPLRFAPETGRTETLSVKIPAGIQDGQSIRLRGQGQPAPRRGTPGDLLLTIRVEPHPWYRRQGNDLYVRVPVTLGEAAAGAKIDVPTPRGVVTLKVPPATSGGTKLRVKGRGVEPASGGAAGDLFAEVQIVLPRTLDAATTAALQSVDTKYPLEPRDELQW